MKTLCKTLGTLLVVALCATTSFAQQAVLKGCITDANSQPMVGVNVLVRSAADSALVAGTITNADGLFELRASAQPKLIVQLQMMGYERQTINVEPKANQVIDLDTIALAEESQMLEGATVVAKKNHIRFEAGKTILTPSASILTSQGNVLDVLKNIPGLIISEDGTIILNGQKGVTVQVNGKSSFLSGSALINQLQSLAAQSVDQLEVITSPTAQYDASGKGGVINIRLQKQQLLGKQFNANVNFRKGQYAYGDIWARGNIQNPKSGMYAEYFKAQGDREHHNNVEAKASNPWEDPNVEGDEIFESPHYLQTIYKDASNMLKLGGDVQLSPSTSINGYASGNFYRRHVPGVSKGAYRLLGQEPDSVQDTRNHSFMRQTTFNGGIGIEYADAAKRTANFSVDVLKYTHDESLDRFGEMTNLRTQAIRPDTLFGDLLSEILMGAVQANYSAPLFGIMKLETGLKVSIVDIDNSAYYRYPKAGEYVQRQDISSKYLYTENNNAAYIQASGQLGPLGFNLGLRAENTRIDGLACAIGAAGTDSLYKLRYTELFPTAAVQLYLSQSSFVALTYNRRITRPNYRELSPFNQMWDEYAISKGNPKLRAELTSNFDLSYTFLSAFRLSAQYSTTQRAMSQCFARQSNGGFVIFPDNLGSSRTIGAKFEAGRIVNLRWWQAGAQVQVYRTTNKWDELGRERTLRQTTYNAGINSQFLFGSGWSGQIQAYYNSDMAYGQILVKGFGTVSAGVQKSLWDNRATVRLVANDIFSTLHQTIVFDNPSIVGKSRQRNDETYIGLSVSCNLKSGTTAEKRKRDTTIEESKRINL